MLQLQYSLLMSLEVVRKTKAGCYLALDRSVAKVCLETAVVSHSTQHPKHPERAKSDNMWDPVKMSQSDEEYGLYKTVIGCLARILIGYKANR